MNSPNELQGREKSSFDVTAFTNNFVDAIEEGNESKITKLMKELSNNQVAPFRQFSAKFDKQAKLLKYIFSPQFQNLPAELRAQIRTQFLNGLDYSIRNGQIYRANQLTPIELYDSLVKLKNAQGDKSRQITSLFNKTFMYCHELADTKKDTDPKEYQAILDIFDQIRRLFVEKSFYEYAFFFNYLLYRFSNKSDTFKYLIEIIKLSVLNPDKERSVKHIRHSFFKNFRAFFFHELKTLIVSETESIFELMTSCNDTLTKPEKYILVNCLRSANVTHEQKFRIYLRIFKFDRSLNLEIVELQRLASQITNISLEDLAILESIIKDGGQIDAGRLQFLELHDSLAKKMNAPTICSKYTGCESVQEYAQKMSSEYNKNDSLLKTLFIFACACYSKNFQVIDRVINDTLEKLSDDKISANDPRLNLFDLFDNSPFDDMFDHFVQHYSNNDYVTLMLIRSGSVEVIKRMDNTTFEKWLKWPKMLAVFMKNVAINPSCCQAFLDRAEKLSTLEIVTRTKFFNEPNQDSFFPLDQALFLKNDLLAIRLFKLGARKTTNRADSADVFVAALSFGCIQFALHLLEHDKSLRLDIKGIQFFNSKVRTAILQSGLAITKFPPLGQSDVQLSLNQVIDESIADPIQSLLQSIKITYILQSITPDEKALLNLHRSQEYLSLREIYKKTTLSDSALIDFFANDTNTSLNPDKAILLAKNSNLIRCLDSRKSWTYVTKQYQLQMPKDFIVVQKPTTPWENKPTHEVVRGALKSRYLGQYPFTVTLLIDLLKSKQDKINEDDKLPNQELYLLFNKHIVMGEFQSPVLAYLFLSLPELTFDLENKDLPEVLYLSLAVFMLIRASYASNEQFLKLLAQLTSLNSRFVTIVQQSQQHSIFCEYLPGFLRRVRPEHADFITESFSPLLLKLSSNKAVKTIINQDEDPTTRFEQVLNSDDIQAYKLLVKDYPNFFQNNILSHALKVCLKDDSKILAFLFKQHKLQNIKFTPNDITKVLEEIIRTNESGFNLAHANQYNFVVTPDVFYLLALRQGKYNCADALMPSFVSSDLLRETAKLGPAALLKRALNANCRLESKEEHLVSYQELENICINDRDKLTAIALSRITTKKQWEDKFGTTGAKKTRKIKTTNPNDKDKFNEFMHRLELFKRYSKLHTDSKELSPDDLKACNLILKKLKKAYERCGYEAIMKYLNDASLSQQLKPFLQSTVTEVNKLEKKASLLDSIIVAQLESLYSIFNTEKKPKEKAAVSIDSREDKKIKKKKKIKKRSKAPTSSNTPVIVVEGPGLYGFFEQKQMDSEKNFTDPKEEHEDVISHHESDSLLAINKEIASTLEEIINFTAQIANAHELHFFPEKECNFLVEKFMKLKELFWELDDDLAESSPFRLHKEQLELFDCNQTADDVKRHITLLAKQFVLPAKQAPTPIKNVESEKAKSFTFFQPAILREDINQFCLKRLTELRQLLLTPETDDVHFCVFRIVNALGDVYRPARRIRHLLIHEFYNINTQDLIMLAQNLLKIDLADKGTFLSIEKCALYEQSLEFMQLILRPGKRPKPDLHKILYTTVEKLRMSHDAHNHRQLMWQSVLIGELAKQMDICSSPVITRHTESQCQILRNRVAHEDYKKSLANEDDPTLLCNARISRAELIASTIKTSFVSVPVKPL